jgi:thiol:disulfide interchange protein DsbC
MRHVLHCAALLLGAGIVSAGESPNAAITAAIQRLAPGARVDSVRPSGLPGVMEVVFAGSVVYASEDGKYILNGRLLDSTTRSDLTENTEKTLRAAALKQIGPEKRLTFAAENPKHHVTVFTDVDCGYCRKLHQEIASYNAAGISVDYLFFPRAGLNSPSFDKAAFIWCSDDKKLAMNQSMSPAGTAHAPANCKHPIGETLALGQRIAKAGTPTILADDGSFLGGYQSAAELSGRLLAQNARSAP